MSSMKSDIAFLVWESQRRIEPPADTAEKIIAIVRKAMLSEKAMMAARDIEMDMEGAWGFCRKTTPAMLDAAGLVAKHE